MNSSNATTKLAEDAAAAAAVFDAEPMDCDYDDIDVQKQKAMRYCCFIKYSHSLVTCLPIFMFSLPPHATPTKHAFHIEKLSHFHAKIFFH